MVYQLALHLLGDRDEALDLSQEVFFSVFRTIHNFRGQSALKTWIYRIVINQARNRQRWWRRRHTADQVSLDQHVAAHGDLRSPATTPRRDRAYARKELAARLWSALDHLPFDQRTVIVLREIDGLSYEEIAFSLGVAIGTVKSRLTRARQTLRDRTAGGPAMMHAVHCADVRDRLEAFHDGELTHRRAHRHPEPSRATASPAALVASELDEVRADAARGWPSCCPIAARPRPSGSPRT